MRTYMGSQRSSLYTSLQSSAADPCTERMVATPVKAVLMEVQGLHKGHGDAPHTWQDRSCRWEPAEHC